MESQLELNNERMKLFDKHGQALPDLKVAEDSVRAEVYHDGALSVKVKRLMSLGIALQAGCTNCILSQTMHALEAGATRDEILEATSVAVSMGGTMTVGESLRVIKLLDELGKLQLS